MQDALGKRPRTRALVGDPAASLLQMDQENEKPVLLALGGLGPYEHVRIGSVFDKVMRAARGSFLFIPWHGTAKAGRTASSRARKRSVWK